MYFFFKKSPPAYLSITESLAKILNEGEFKFTHVEMQIIREFITTRTAEGSWRARMAGSWTAQAPKGYDNLRDDKKSTLRPHPIEAPLMTDGFNMLASGTYSADEVRRWLNDNKLKIS